MSQSLPSCPLRRPTLRLARALIRVHCRLRGEILKTQQGVQPRIPSGTANPAMEDIEFMLRFLGVEFDPNAIRAIMAGPGGPDGHPLGIATRELARDLLRFHMRLTGELAKHADGEVALVELAEVHRLLAGIANLMGLLGVDFDPAALPSIRTRPQSTALEHGGMCTGGVVRALKDAERPRRPGKLPHPWGGQTPPPDQ